MKQKSIRLNPEDNVALALSELARGQSIGHDHLRGLEKIPSGHKVAIRKIDAGQPILKYGQITGMIAGGANMVCFTTGRGTVCGFKPVPTLKLATNSEM